MSAQEQPKLRQGIVAYPATSTMSLHLATEQVKSRMLAMSPADQAAFGKVAMDGVLAVLHNAYMVKTVTTTQTSYENLGQLYALTPQLAKIAFSDPSLVSPLVFADSAGALHQAFWPVLAIIGGVCSRLRGDRNNANRLADELTRLISDGAQFHFDRRRHAFVGRDMLSLAVPVITRRVLGGGNEEWGVQEAVCLAPVVGNVTRVLDDAGEYSVVGLRPEEVRKDLRNVRVEAEEIARAGQNRAGEKQGEKDLAQLNGVLWAADAMGGFGTGETQVEVCEDGTLVERDLRAVGKSVIDRFSDSSHRCQQAAVVDRRVVVQTASFLAATSRAVGLSNGTPILRQVTDALRIRVPLLANNQEDWYCCGVRVPAVLSAAIAPSSNATGPTTSIRRIIKSASNSAAPKPNPSLAAALPGTIAVGEHRLSNSPAQTTAPAQRASGSPVPSPRDRDHIRHSHHDSHRQASGRPADDNRRNEVHRTDHVGGRNREHERDWGARRPTSAEHVHGYGHGGGNRGRSGEDGGRGGRW